LTDTGATEGTADLKPFGPRTAKPITFSPI
jgi:hypothetical protein